MVGNNCKSNARSGRKKSKHLPPSTKPSKAGLSFRRTLIAPTLFNGRHGSSPSSADGPATPRIGHPDQSPSTTEWLASKSSSLAEPPKMFRNTSAFAGTTAEYLAPAQPCHAQPRWPRASSSAASLWLSISRRRASQSCAVPVDRAGLARHLDGPASRSPHVHRHFALDSLHHH